MKTIRLGFAICGSFCTFSKALEQIKLFDKSEYDIIPIFSEYAYNTDTRFYNAKDYVKAVEEACGNKSIKTIKEAEPIGPKELLDVIVVAPCTGNTLGKLAAGINDTSVTMAVKAHLRNNRPVVIGISTNDALGACGANIGALINRRNYYFVPFNQDNPLKKPRSIVCDFTLIEKTVQSALAGEQIQPIII